MRRRVSAFIAPLALILLATTALAAQMATSPAPPHVVKRVTSVAGVNEYSLENGMRVLLAQDQSKPVVTVNVTYLVGSGNESYGETGMAHLLEHLMFKGTPTHPNVPDEISKHGARANGTTNTDRTNYYETFPSTDDNIDWALGLEADRMVHSFIAKHDLDSEMTVVRNEFEHGENNPAKVLLERVLETAYLWHNYGHPTIGARSDIENVPIEHLQAFYRTYYQPDNAVLIVSGKFDENRLLEEIARNFGSIPKPMRVLPHPYTVEPVQDGEREVTLRRVGDVQAVIAAFHMPPDGHPDSVALDMLIRILSDPSSGRLRRRLVDTNLAARAIASTMSMHDAGILRFTATVSKNGNVQAAKEELLKIAEGIPQEPVTDVELSRARNRMLDELDKASTDPVQLAALLSEGVAVGDWRLLFWERDQANKLTVDDLTRVAKTYLVNSNLTVGLFIPEDEPKRAPIPAAPDYATVLRNYTGDQTMSKGEAFDPTPANIEARVQRKQIGAIKLALLPKKTRGNLVNIVFNIHFGNEKSLENQAEAGQLTARMLMRGTAQHDMTELRDLLTQSRTQMKVGGDGNGVNVEVLTDREHLPAALRLAHEVLENPGFPEKEFGPLKQQTLASLESARTDPASIARLSMSRALSPYPQGHVRYVPTLEESIDHFQRMNLHDVERFYHQFYGVGAAELGAVGDFDPRELTGLVNELFGNWKSSTQYERVARIYKSIEPGTKSFETPDKANAVFVAGTTLELKDDDVNYPALVLGNYIFGGGFMNSRLATRIRQKEGLSYNVNSGISADPFDKAGIFVANAICAPQNETKVAVAFQQELERAVYGGFSAEEIAGAKSGYLQARRVTLSDDGDLAADLAEHLYIGRTFDWDEKYERNIQSLNPQQLTESFRRFIDPKKLTTVAAGDFAKASN